MAEAARQHEQEQTFYLPTAFSPLQATTLTFSSGPTDSPPSSLIVALFSTKVQTCSRHQHQVVSLLLFQPDAQVKKKKIWY